LARPFTPGRCIEGGGQKADTCIFHHGSVLDMQNEHHLCSLFNNNQNEYCYRDQTQQGQKEGNQCERDSEDLNHSQISCICSMGVEKSSRSEKKQVLKMSRKTRYWRARSRKPTLLHQRQATAGAPRQEKVRNDSGQTTGRRVASRREGLQACATRQYLG